MHRDRDPYAPPPRHKERSGAVVRFVIIAALLGVAVWGYTEFADQPQTASLVPPAGEQTMADAGMDTGYQVEQPNAQQAPAPQAAPSSAPASAPSEPVPPPTTTTEPPPA
jgi:hypothetical protein